MSGAYRASISYEDIDDTVVIYPCSERNRNSSLAWIAHTLETDMLSFGATVEQALAHAIDSLRGLCECRKRHPATAKGQMAPENIREMAKTAQDVGPHILANAMKILGS